MKNSCMVGMPINSAALAGPAAGSIPRTGMPGLGEVLEQVPVVAGDLDDQAVRSQTAASDQVLSVDPRMLEQRPRY